MQSPSEQHIFYEIITPTNKKNYLLGTLHLSDDLVNTFSSEMAHAFGTASLLCVECDVTSSEEFTLGESLNKWRSKFFHEHLHWLNQPKQVKTIIDALTRCFPQNNDIENLLTVKAYPPMFILHMLCQPVVRPVENSENILDYNLIYMARKNSKSLCELESASSGYLSLMGYDLSYIEQLQFIELWASYYDAQKFQKISDETRDSYIEGNHFIIASDCTPINESEKALLAKYYQISITERDKQMAEKLELNLLRGNTFVAVGAAHLRGILDIYKNKNYDIKPIPITKRIYPVLGYYERNMYDMEKVGLASIFSVALGSMGLFVSLQFVKTILFALAAVLFVYALFKATLLLYRYGIEPIQYGLDPKLIQASVKNAQTNLSAYSMFKQENRDHKLLKNHDLDEVLETIDSFAPILFLDLNAKNNIQNIINYNGQHYQLKEAIHKIKMQGKSLSQVDLDNLLQHAGDPRRYVDAQHQHTTSGYCRR